MNKINTPVTFDVVIDGRAGPAVPLMRGATL